MTNYKFVFIAEGLPACDSDNFLDALDQFGATWSRLDDEERITVNVNRYDDCLLAAGWLLAKLPDLMSPARLLRIDPMLITSDEILTPLRQVGADVDISDVNEWKRQETFPPRETRIGAQDVWRWGDIHAWMRHHHPGPMSATAYPTRLEALHIDMALATGHLDVTHLETSGRRRLVEILTAPQDPRRVNGKPGLWWEHCSPELVGLVKGGCVELPRRECHCPHIRETATEDTALAVGHDHQVPLSIVLALSIERRDSARWEPAP